jgi:hypothetical protein
VRFASGCQSGQAPREALAGVCPGPVALGPLSQGSEEWRWVDGELNRKNSLGFD